MFKPGDRYKKFLVKKVLFIEELKVHLIELIHEPSGAQIMHIENNDPENVFCLSFETMPTNSKGVAHILEHTVLCGSQKFPVKDPFFRMIRRSLNTYMNALTGADFTCYPAASQVEKDFYNLLEVYLDAVFHPLLTKESFAQEGHRLEFKNPKDDQSSLEWKGIVYNEMKGALQSADSRLWHTLLKHLVPNLTYSHISGGSPEEIPQLTYEELFDFHRIYYHPSHCLFFFYGSFPLKKHLDFIDDKILKTALKLEPLPQIKPQKRFLKPIQEKGFYPITDTKNLDKSVIMSWGWLTTSIQDQEMVLALTLLDAVLTETDASPLKFALLNSKLCSSVEACLDIDIAEVPYLIVCKGCKGENLKKLEELLFQTLRKIASEGISSHLIDAALHQLEFERMEITGDHAPFGLTLFMKSALIKQHGCEPETSLIIHTLFKKLREKLKDPNYLVQILEKYIIDNPHRVSLELYPDPKLIQKEAEEEKRKLEALQHSLSAEEKVSIQKTSQQLVQYQHLLENQSLECLPKVTLKDVPPLSRDFTLNKHKDVFFHPCFTNHIIYADLGFDLPVITENDLPYLQLLTSLLPDLGIGKRDYIQNLEYIQSHVGMLSLSLTLHPQIDDPSHLRPTLNFRSKALQRNSKEMFILLHDLALQSRLDETRRIEELILQIHTDLQNRLQKNSLRYATQIALSGFSAAPKIIEQWTGLSYFKWIQNIVNNLSKELPLVVKRLRDLKEKVFSFHNPQLVISSDENLYQECQKEDFFGLFDFPKKIFEHWKNPENLEKVSSQARPIASAVACTCEAFKVSTLMGSHASALTVATYLLDNTVLHPRIREQGGAYSSGATYSPIMGHFTFHAYRDPHIHLTLEAFKEAILSIAQGKFTEADLEAAKLETIQQLDHPIAPGSRGITAYNWLKNGMSLTIRQNRRNQILALKASDIQIALQEELVQQISQGKVVTFASQELIEKENQILEKPLPIIPI